MEEHLDLSSGDRAVLSAIRAHFSGPTIAGLLPLVQGNDVWRSFRVASFDEQRPTRLIFTCPQADPDIVFSNSQPGISFPVLARGLAGKIAHLASANYAVEHLKDEAGQPSVKAILVMAHACTSKASIPCRTQVGTMPMGERAYLADLKKTNPSWSEGLTWLDISRLPNQKAVPPTDWLHARASLVQILQYSEPIRELTKAGKQIVVQAWYDNDTGEAVISSILIAKDASEEFKQQLIEVASGCYGGKLDELHPSARELWEIKFRNQIHMANFRPKVETEVLVLGCSDSRTSPQITTQAPNGMIEVVRNAGLMVNQDVRRSMVIGIEDALLRQRAAGRTEHVTLVVLAHSDCGAAKATLSKLSGGGLSPEDDTNLARPIIQKLYHRFAAYLEEHPDYRESDPLLSEAARHNAIGAAFDLLGDDQEYAMQLKNWMREGKLDIVPAVYSLDGMLTFLRPIPAPDSEAEQSENG